MNTTMPEAWVRGAIVIRMNSLVRGHSGVRWELVEKMRELLDKDVIPVVPLRGSISASGDLSPLSYIAGTMIGNPAIRCWTGPANARVVVPSTEALKTAGIEPLKLLAKEPLGILNGTAFSASVSALALSSVSSLLLLSQACTALGIEALLGSVGSFDPFIHDICRPHPGQVEVAKLIRNSLQGSKLAVFDDAEEEREVSLDDDRGVLRQDRYALRTSPQWLGPQVEDVIHAAQKIQQELNSTTDNPLMDPATGRVHHGGNFQAMALTSAMEHSRLAVHHVGKLLFSQCTELVNPTMNRGLPPNMAATDPSLNYACKGIDIACAAYLGELGFLAGNVSSHVQSAEMHNQAVNSLALVSARYTIHAVEVLSLLTANYLYVLCQALDLRALQHEFSAYLTSVVTSELTSAFTSSLSTSELRSLITTVVLAMRATLDSTTTMDVEERMEKVAASASAPLLQFFTSPSFTSTTSDLNILQSVRNMQKNTSTQLSAKHRELQRAYLLGERGSTPASHSTLR